MSRASFLLGTRRVSSKTSSSAGPGEIGDEDGQIEFSLARASDLAIVDDSYLAKLFADAFIGAPEVSLTWFSALAWTFLIVNIAGGSS